MLIQQLNSTITIDLEGLGRALLALAGIAVLVVLAIVLSKLVGTITRINRVIETVTPDIKSSVASLPETMKHVNEITSNVVDVTDDLAVEFPKIMSSVSSVSETSAELFQSAASVVDEVTGVVAAVLRFVKRPLASASVVRDVMHGASKFKKARKRRAK